MYSCSFISCLPVHLEFSPAVSISACKFLRSQSSSSSFLLLLLAKFESPIRLLFPSPPSKAWVLRVAILYCRTFMRQERERPKLMKHSSTWRCTVVVHSFKYRYVRYGQVLTQYPTNTDPFPSGSKLDSRFLYKYNHSFSLWPPYGNWNSFKVNKEEMNEGTCRPLC